MNDKPVRLRFYHSVVCPRCHYAGLVLKSALLRHPGIALEKIEVLANRERARSDGVTIVPALVADGGKLSGFILTRRRIERFLETLTARPAPDQS